MHGIEAKEIVIMDENTNWMKLAHLLSIVSLNLGGPFCTSTYTSKFLITILNVQIKENKTSPICILCMLIPQILPLFTFTLVDVKSPSPIHT